MIFLCVEKSLYREGSEEESVQEEQAAAAWGDV